MISFDDGTQPELDLLEEPTDVQPILRPKSSPFVINDSFFDEVTEVLPEGHCEWSSLAHMNSKTTPSVRSSLR